MAFWNKGEDPWNVKPKPVSVPNPDCDGEPDTVLDSLKAWNKERKAEKAKRETPQPPMTCPWCGKEMEAGYIMGNRASGGRRDGRTPGQNGSAPPQRKAPGRWTQRESFLPTRPPGIARIAENWWQTSRRRPRSRWSGWPGRWTPGRPGNT